MANINNQPAVSGNYINSNGEIVNIVDILKQGNPIPYNLVTAKDILNRSPALTGNMIASDGSVYNIVDLLSQVEAGVLSSNVPTANGTNVQVELDSLNIGLGELAEGLQTVKNDLGDIGDIQNSLANEHGKFRFKYVKTVLPTDGQFEIDLAENKDYCLDCKLILSQSGADLEGHFSQDGTNYDAGLNYSNRLDHRSTSIDNTEVLYTDSATGFSFNYNPVPSGLVNLYIDLNRGNSLFQPFLRSTLEYMEADGTAEYVEQIGGYKLYGCKKFRLTLTAGTFNDLNNVQSHIDIYERI